MQPAAQAAEVEEAALEQRLALLEVQMQIESDRTDFARAELVAAYPLLAAPMVLTAVDQRCLGFDSAVRALHAYAQDAIGNPAARLRGAYPGVGAAPTAGLAAPITAEPIAASRESDIVAMFNGHVPPPAAELLGKHRIHLWLVELPVPFLTVSTRGVVPSSTGCRMHARLRVRVDACKPLSHPRSSAWRRAS